jgi:hypothetical protein
MKFIYITRKLYTVRLLHGSLNFKVFLLQIRPQHRTDDNVINYGAFLLLFHPLILPFTTLRLSPYYPEASPKCFASNWNHTSHHRGLNAW